MRTNALKRLSSASFMQGMNSAFNLFPDPIDYSSMIRTRADLNKPLNAGFAEDRANLRGDAECALRNGLR